MKTTYTAKELMEVALMCLENSEPPRFYCWKDGTFVRADSAEYRRCKFQGHDLELEGVEPEEKTDEKGAA